MIDFSLTEEQKMLQETVNQFALNEMRPIAREVDQISDPANSFPFEVVKKALQLGVGKIFIPKKYGGYGGGLMEYSLISEGLGYGDVGIAMPIIVTMSLSRVIIIGGPEELKERWLTAICEDESGGYIIAGCITEPSGGSEIFCPLPDPKLGVQTTAIRDGNEYVINGRKNFITSAGYAKIYQVLVRTDKTKPNFEGCSLFLVPEGTPGLLFGKIEDKMGHRGAVNGEVIFEDMRVPKENMIGKEGEGFSILLQMYLGNGIGVGSMAVGLARAAYDDALKYANGREIWGKPIRQYEGVADKLVNVRMKIEASRALVWKMAWAVDHPELSGGLDKLGPMAKVYPTSLIRGIMADIMQIFGGYSYMKDFLVEKYVRDAMVMPVYDGSNDVLRLFLAQDL